MKQYNYAPIHVKALYDDENDENSLYGYWIYFYIAENADRLAQDALLEARGVAVSGQAWEAFLVNVLEKEREDLYLKHDFKSEGDVFMTSCQTTEDLDPLAGFLQSTMLDLPELEKKIDAFHQADGFMDYMS